MSDDRYGVSVTFAAPMAPAVVYRADGTTAPEFHLDGDGLTITQRAEGEHYTQAVTLSVHDIRRFLAMFRT